MSTARQVARRVMEMTAALHARGYESLGLVCGLSPSGAAWRYQFVVIPESGDWSPRSTSVLAASLGSHPALSWGQAEDSPSTLCTAFETVFANELDPCRAPNAAYAAWFRNMLAAIPAEHVLIMYSDYNAFDSMSCTGVQAGKLDLPMPPGFSKRPG